MLKELYFQNTAFQNGESQVSASHSSMFMLGQSMNMSLGNLPLGQFQRENALRHSNRLWSMLLRSQKSNDGEINSIHVPWIPVLPGLLKGNQTQANNTVWENCLLKKPRERTLAKHYWKPVTFIPHYQSGQCWPSFSFNYYFPGGWRQKAILSFALFPNVLASL